MSDNEERQELELSSLKAIYPELIDLRNERKLNQTNHHNRKNYRQQTWRPIEFRITLKPNSEPDNVHCQIDLFIKCTHLYPKEKPSIEFKNVVGLPNKIITQLAQKLTELTEELAEKDEESLFMCISKVEEFLNENNKPGTKSFYDQMVSNQLAQQEEEERLRLEQMSKNLKNKEELSKVIKQAMDEKQKLLENESKRLRKPSFIEDDQLASSINSLKLSISKFKEKFQNKISSFKSYQMNRKNLRSCTHNHQASIDYKFKTIISGNELIVQKLSCDLHGDLFTDYLAIDKNSSSFYLLSEYQTSKINLSKEERNRLMKDLLAIKTKFDHKLILLNHPHIIHPLAFIYSLENDSFNLRLLHNHIKHNIRFCDLPFVLSSEQQEIRSTFYFIQLLDAINYLHSINIYHGNLNPENIMLDLSTGQIKLINSFVQSHLNDFIEQINKSFSYKSFTLSNEIAYSLDYLSFGLLICWFKLEFKLDFKHLLSIKQTDLIKKLQEHNCSNSEIELIKNCLNKQSITMLEPYLIEYFEQACENVSENAKKPTNFITEIDPSDSNDHHKDLQIASKNSRLSDFEILSKLGQGGFGEVYKVRNLLDQNFYALKKIKMNTSNKLLNKKIKQEVRYLSGLFHENVIRYYSSWIEYEFIDKNGDEIDFIDQQSDKDYFTEDSIDSDNSDEAENEDLTDAHCLFSNSLCLPEFKNKDIDVSDSYVVFQDSKDGDKNYTKNLEDESIKSDNSKEKVGNKIKKISTNNPSPYNEYLFIQMELCEKSTLQHAIYSQELYQDTRRSRRLFREIIEALAYLHDLFIIHRDLKPGNIFLDHNDRVKIGDFGLATSFELLRIEQPSNQVLDSLTISQNQSNMNQSMTLNQNQTEIVGTPFYLSPEIQAKSQDHLTKKITYTQKVDQYSCGIIFFEMCYKPPTTGMERFKILTNLRLPEIIFPDDADKYLNPQEIMLIKQLLNHNPKERPSSSELLGSEYLPPPEIEEAKQQIMIKQVIQNPRSKLHKFLLSTLFNRQMNNVEEIVYDSEIDVVKSKKLINNEQLKARVFQFVSDRLKNIFKRYGAIEMNAPQFTPANSLSKFNLNHAFSVCDNNGAIIQPPYDLRIPFARFIARNQNMSNIPTFRRYAIDKVFRSRIVGYHPKELYECAFDIITTKTGLNWSILPDVEVLLVLNEIIDSFECLKNKPFTLRVNSIKFLKAVFAYFEIDEQNFDQMLRILAECNDRNFVSRNNDSEYSKTPRDHFNYMLSDKNILESNKINILSQMLLENEKSTAKEMIELVHFYMRRKPQQKQKQAYDQTIDAIKELGLIIDCLQNSCNTFRMKIKFVPNLVLNLSNCNIYSQLIFQLQYDIVKKHQIIHSILANGGRFDDLIESFQINFSSRQDPINEKALMNIDQRAGVGVSLEIEKIVKCVIEDDDQIDMEIATDCDLVIYATVYEDDRFRFTFRDLSQIAYELRSQGYRVKVFNEILIKSLSDLNKFCVDNQIKFLFILNKINDKQNKNLYQLKTMTLEKEKYVDRRCNASMDCYEIIEYIKQELISSSNSNSTNYSSSPFGQFNLNQLNSNFIFEGSSCSITSNYMSSSFSTNVNTSNLKFSNNQTSDNQSNAQPVNLQSKITAATNIQFIEVEKSLEFMTKKKMLNLISLSISNKLNNSVNNSIEVLTLEIPFKILKLVAYELEFDKDCFGNIADSMVEENIKRIIEKCPKFRNQIKALIYKIIEIKRRKDQFLIILCSVYDIHDFKSLILP